jgi:serine/threonine protein kinase/Tfp pilus assembly protein PilF
MSLSASRRTWEEAISPAAVRLAQEYEQVWRDAELAGRQPELGAFIAEANGAHREPGARLAVLRADMGLRWEKGEKVGAQWYCDRYHDLGADTIVALVYEEFCLQEEDDQHPDPSVYLARFPQVAASLSRVFQIHDLVGSGATATVAAISTGDGAGSGSGGFPEAGQTIAGFYLVEELGRGAFARVFLARERQLADRPVALKVTRRGSHEPQTLARLQHTHIVPVHSHRIDAATGLHLLCMPYFGRITLAQLLADPEVQSAQTGAVLLDALDRLDPADELPAGRPAGRETLAARSYSQAIAWWGARLAEALDHAHDRGVLHRDIKPSNVLVTADGMPMLLDFNLAREPVVENGEPAAGAALGGTIDYMPPEHLKALAEGSADGVDGRGDIYALGVVLYEAVIGKRPFASPRKSSSVIQALLRAADARLAPLPRLRRHHPEIPPALEAVIRRCLEPDRNMRYQRASELAADLDAVADDVALRHAREPWSSRVTGWLRRRRRRLATAAALLVTISALLVAGLAVLLERSKQLAILNERYEKGLEALKNRDYSAAKEHFDAANDLAGSFEISPRGILARLTDLPSIGSQLRDRWQQLRTGRGLDEIKANAPFKAGLAERSGRVRDDADALFRAADGLRFRLLLGESKELVQASRKLQKNLEPFYVLANPHWTNLEHTLNLLDKDRHDRLVVEVNELLFLWIAAIDESVGAVSEPSEGNQAAEEKKALDNAVAICQRALNWVEPPGPWRALKARLESHRIDSPAPRRAAGGARELMLDEPRRVIDENSALACFQWGLLCYRQGRLAAAIDWLERAVQLKAKNYWYQFLLAFLKDQAGYLDEALNHYSIAAALEPESPGVRFSRSRLYRAKGLWDLARDDMLVALGTLAGQPEAARVRLELGYLYQELGDFRKAGEEYEAVIATDESGVYARAARLNQANIAAESGDIKRARQEYDSLLLTDLDDSAARHSRALLELRLGQAEPASIDLTALLDRKQKLPNRDEILAARALAFLILGRGPEAVADATEARIVRPSPAHERLVQRALLAAHQAAGLQLDRPEDLALLPLSGERLRVDLRAADRALEKLAGQDAAVTFRAALNQAVVLAALGQREAAVKAATRALNVSPASPRAYLIRARVRAFAGDRRGAWDDVEAGISIQSSEPGLLELRGVLREQAGDHRGALDDFRQAVAAGAFERIHVHRAVALASLGQYEASIQEWSLALRRDPELPEAYLGRARVQLGLRRWDVALADLEQAASWAQSDPWLELRIVAAYARCLQARPNHQSRWLVLARRAVVDLWRSFVPPPAPPARPGM